MVRAEKIKASYKLNTCHLARVILRLFVNKIWRHEILLFFRITPYFSVDIGCGEGNKAR